MDWLRVRACVGSPAPDEATLPGLPARLRRFRASTGTDTDSTFLSGGSLEGTLPRSCFGLDSLGGDLARCRIGLSGSIAGAEGAAGKGMGDGSLSLFHSGFCSGLGGVARAQQCLLSGEIEDEVEAAELSLERWGTVDKKVVFVMEPA